MRNDPAFLFYPGDASEDTQHLDRLERGAYFDILKAQKRFGRFTLDQLKKILGKDFEAVWPALQMCLTHEEDMFFISWVDESIAKRKAFSESRRNNRKGSKNSEVKNISETQEKDMNNISATSVEDMGIENGNGIENEDEIVDKGVQGDTSEFRTPAIDPGASVLLVPELLNVWKAVKPDYIVNQQADFPALREIGKMIAQASQIKNYTGIESVDKIKQAWLIICNFIVKDDFFRDYQLSQVSKYFNNIISKIKSQKEGKKEAPVKLSVIEHNRQALEGARELLRKKYSQQTQ